MIFSRHNKRRQVGIFVIICWVLCSKTVGAQDYVITKLKLFPDRDEILVKDVTRDSLGFIWYLTNGEIYRFDGYRSLDILKTISDQQLTQDMPQRILIDDNHRLWMAGNANLNYLDLKTWKVNPVPSHFLPPIQDRTVYSITRLADQTVVVAYENGHLLLIKNNQYRLIDNLYQRSKKENNKVSPRGITFWKSKIWVGTTGGGLLTIDPHRKFSTQFRQLNGIKSWIRYLVAHDDTLFLSMEESKTFQFPEGIATQTRSVDFVPSLDKYYVLEEAKRMNAYADDESLYLLNSNIRIRQRLKIPSNHKYRSTSVQIFDDEVLLGTEEGIFVAYPKTKGLSQLIPENSGTNKSTRGIYTYSDGSIFYATYNGAGYIDPKGKVVQFPELRHGYVFLPMNADELLVGTEGGFLKVFNRRTQRIAPLAFKLSQKAKTKYAAHLPLYVMCLTETPTDYLIGGMNGLWVLDKKKRTLDRYPLEESTPHALDIQIRHIQQKGKNDLLLSTNMGLFQVNHEKMTKLYPKTGNTGVYKSLIANDTIWLATQGNGLVAADLKGNVLRHISKNEGLSNNLIYSFEWFNGIKILGTANGLNLVDPQQRVRRIGTAEGLQQSEFNSGASFVDRLQNRVYMGGLMGYTVLDMNQDWFKKGSELSSFVSEIHTSAGNSGIKKTDYTWPYLPQKEFILAPDQSLTGLYIGTPKNYRLNGELGYTINSGEMEPLNPGQFISLIEPSPGQYHIRLQTISTGIASADHEISFHKKPYFYQTWWFRGLLILSIILAIVAWYRTRISKIHREHSIRNRIAADLHDEVGSSLTRIFYQASNLTAHQTTPEKQEKQLELIASTSKQALLIMSDMVWSIDSRFDTVKDLVIRMKDYAYRLREELDFTYRFEETGHNERSRISQVIRQNLFLIFKEALTNAIKYSDGSEIVIRWELGNTVRLEITNGYSQNQNMVHDRQGGRGLENMKERAAKVGGTLKVSNSNGIFTIIFELPPQRGI